MEPTTNGIKTWQWVVTIIVIIVLIIVGISVFGNKSTPTPSGEQLSNENVSNTGSINRIVMSDQYPGNVVYISSVQLSQPGWVAIAKDNGGQPGSIIGSAYFDKGINPGKVTLSESTVEGGTYYAIIYTDDGDRKFDVAKDQPLKDMNGNTIMKVFHASASASMELKG